MSNRVISNPFSGTDVSLVITPSVNVQTFFIVNNGSDTFTALVTELDGDTKTLTLKSGELYELVFNPITSVTITNASSSSFSGYFITGEIENPRGYMKNTAASFPAYVAQSTNALSLAEVDKLDISAQSETVDSGDAVSVLVKNTKVDNTTNGAGAITLGVPDATMYGLVKTIEMTVDNGDVTLALTNVQGGSAATTATFAVVNDCLVLIGGTSKWHVICESGVLLS